MRLPDEAERREAFRYAAAQKAREQAQRAKEQLRQARERMRALRAGHQRRQR